ncbi:MAG: 4-hydroxy-tetrahydrodipicolinate synthase [Chitinophagia bacterium]|nr:4-hydroxy-tetrahydrodipicolinate synthase [Chitinophagia bacterium]
MTKSLKGTGVALVTPFTQTGAIDYPALEALVNNVIKGGVDFLVTLGTTGETPTLTDAEKQQVLEATLKFADDRVPVVCGIGGNVTADVLHHLNNYNLRGVVAILSVAPYYNKPTQEGLYQHFAEIARNTHKNIILYNVPGRTGSNLLPATVARLASDFKNIIGIKEASGNMAQCMELLNLVSDDFLVFSGDDDLALAHMAIGMDGVISVAANCFTREFTEMINLTMINKYERAQKIHYKLLKGINMLFAEGNPAGVKATLAHQGLIQNVLRLPLVPVSQPLSESIAAFTAQLAG